jgi:ABC-type sugar transport system ATPase subunit
MDGEVILKAEGISKSFYGVKVLDKVGLELKKGQVHALCGENGAGKSTLLKIITGLYTKNEGTITIEGRPVEISNVPEARKFGIHVVPQEIQIVRELSVAENIFLGRYPKTKVGTLDWKKMYGDAEAVKKRLGGQAERLNVRARVGSLGMGAWQLIEIMRALIDEKVHVLAFDEPTSSLSDEEAENLFKMIETLKKQGVAIIYVSHRLIEIFRICDEVSVFRDGKYIGTRATAETTNDELIGMMIGRSAESFFKKQRKENHAAGEVILEARNFSHGNWYRDVNLTIRKGEILGLYGLVGAGRTEFVRGLFGVDKKDSGEVLINGAKTIIKSPSSALKKGIGFVTENRREEGLLLPCSLKWNVSMPNLSHFINKAHILDLKSEKQYAQEGMKLFSVKTSGIQSLAKSLSGGNQQKVVLTKWVMSRCNILIVDEPTRGIDVGAKSEVYEALQKLADDGAAILMISSELPEILSITDRIMVMCEGRVTATLDNKNLTEKEVAQYAFPS